MKRHLPVFILTLFMFGFISVKAQVATTPVGDNAKIHNFLIDNPGYTFQNTDKNKYSRQDSLSLPFFENFFHSRLYPDSTKWLNNQVYINNEFPRLPSDYNVATFDGLNSSGTPYNATINKDFKGPGDSLISQPINLLFDASNVPYTLSDSIMLSFFYQPNGYGYHLNGEDSIFVFFKAANGLWFKVWEMGGKSTSEDFQHVMIPIKDVNYLHGNFQFMFTTYTRQVGNANHWNLDYVLLDDSRSELQDHYLDQGIQTKGVSSLKDYASMPYDHFKVVESSQLQDQVYFRASNLDMEGRRVNTSASDSFNGMESYYKEDNTSANDVPAYGSIERFLVDYKLDNLNGTPPYVVTRRIGIDPPGIDTNLNNNSLLFTQVFHDYYAYDDGSAERGFGFDQNTNPQNIEGQIAYGFDITKRDTLYAISTFFNQAVYDVSSRRFTYRIWKSLEGVNSAAQDELIYESELAYPVYSSQDGKRTFHSHFLDTLLVIEPGTYYIGWWQQDMFNLNVGWDMNYGNTRNPERSNPKLYYRAIGGWSNSDLPEGTLMMRPYVGSKRDLNASIHNLQAKNESVSLYPNPASSVVSFGKEYETAQLVSMKGDMLISKVEVSSLDIGDVSPGLYFVKLTNKKGEQFNSKLVIIAP